jgi:hypothetical protein
LALTEGAHSVASRPSRVLDWLPQVQETAQPPPLIICEARATRGVLERIAGDYLCPITATGGQCGGFIVNEIVPLLVGNERATLIHVAGVKVRPVCSSM